MWIKLQYALASGVLCTAGMMMFVEHGVLSFPQGIGAASCLLLSFKFFLHVAVDSD